MDLSIRVPSLATDTSNVINPYHNPASRTAIASLENIKVNSKFLEKDPISCCQICKKEFVLDLEVKMFPCKHVYHSECILQWLETKNTCPVCQFQLPTLEDEDYDLQGLPRGENFIGTIIAEELLNDEDEREDDLIHFHDLPTPGWWLDITLVNHFRRQSRGTLALTNVSVSFSEVINCLLISFNQLVMDNEFESVDLSLSMANTGDNGHGVGVMANSGESSGDEGDAM